MADTITVSSEHVHELNNALSAIAGYTEFVLARLPEESPLRRHVLEIQAAGRRAAEVVGSLTPK